ncbi:hypothetical protein EC988_008678, partial [Linderina pennispora]
SPIVRPPQTQRPKPARRFSAVYFALIYLYTLAYGLLTSVPLLDRLLQYLPNPHSLVGDEYQPITTRIPSASTPLGRQPRRTTSPLAHTIDEVPEPSQSTPLRRRASSGSTSTALDDSLAMMKRANRHSMPTVPSTPPSSITRSFKKKTL